MTKRQEQKVLHWIEGQHSDGHWTPLYCYQDIAYAKGVLAHIVSLDELPRELSEYEDFRMMAPASSTSLPANHNEQEEDDEEFERPTTDSVEAPEKPKKGRKGSVTRAGSRRQKRRG